MARRSKKVKSDLLFRLSKSVSESIYPNLKSLNDSRSPGSKQWRLFEYYRSLDSWSREREKSDWPESSFADLKYRTLGWLIRMMNKLGDWPNSELHQMIGDIAWSLENNVGVTAFSLIEEAKELALNCELYSQYQVLLDLERRAILMLAKGKTRHQKLTKLIGENQRTQAIIHEELRVFSIRAEFFDPYVDEIRRSGMISSEIGKRLEDQLNQLNPKDFISGTSQLEYHSLMLWSNLVQFNFEAAKKTADKIEQVQNTRPWLAANDLDRHHRIIWLRVGAYVTANEKQSAETTLDFLQVDKVKTGDILNNRFLYGIWAMFLYYDQFRAFPRQGNALDLFKKHCSSIWEQPPTNFQIWPTFFAVKAALDCKDYEFALQGARWILVNKKVIGEKMLLDVRVMEVICFLGRQVDHEMIRSAAESLIQFLGRHTNHPKYYLQIARSIATIYKNGQDDRLSIEEAQTRAIDSIEQSFEVGQATSNRFLIWLKGCWS